MNGSPSKQDIDRLEVLVSEKCNGSLDEAGQQELNSLIEGSSELCEEYCSLIGFNTDLHWVLSGPRLPKKRTDSLATGTDDSAAELSPVSSVREPTGGTRPLWTLAIAALLLISVGAATSLWRNANDEPASQVAESQVAESRAEPSQPPRPVVDGSASDDLRESAPSVATTPRYAARIGSPSEDSRWRSGGSSEANPEGLRYGDTLRVDEGLIEVRLDVGAVGVLRAPAELLLIASDRVRLVRGKLTVTAPELTNGFTVETASADVVDLGTVFSVEAADAGTDLVVYGGKVDVRLPKSEAESGATDPATAVHLVQGEAVHVDTDGKLSRIMSVQSSPDPMNLLASNRPIAISSVADNSDRDANWSFYEIVSGGMQEDARAYVDRFHEWNGVTPEGMPNYLVGGDYIKMFNEDKATEELRIEVEFSRPSDLYVLLDNRVAPPEWLLAEFTNTGDVIGVDESPHDTANRFPANDQFAQVGAGESIDRVHSIWKRTAQDGEPVTLGPNGEVISRERTDPRPHYIRANMYGIVAVPLDRPASHSTDR